MAYCAPLGIPHSVFCSWDADDRAKALAWQARKWQSCAQCGTRPEEWDPAAGGDVQAYTTRRRVCRGCQVMQGARDAIASENDTPRGEYVQLIPNPDVRR
ncbi:MAG: hypothetical protein ACRDMV_08900 [Streptosporangiales bacterium]